MTLNKKLTTLVDECTYNRIIELALIEHVSSSTLVRNYLLRALKSEPERIAEVVVESEPERIATRLTVLDTCNSNTKLDDITKQFETDEKLHCQKVQNVIDVVKDQVRVRQNREMTVQEEQLCHIVISKRQGLERLSAKYHKGSTAWLDEESLEDMRDGRVT
jgi:hypothetical protein